MNNPDNNDQRQFGGHQEEDTKSKRKITKISKVDHSLSHSGAPHKETSAAAACASPASSSRMCVSNDPACCESEKRQKMSLGPGTESTEQHEDEHDDEKRRLEEKRAYNRRNAARCRQRVKDRLLNLSHRMEVYSTKAAELEKTNILNENKVKELTLENEMLRQFIATKMNRRQSGSGDTCPVLPAMPLDSIEHFFRWKDTGLTPRTVVSDVVPRRQEIESALPDIAAGKDTAVQEQDAEAGIRRLQNSSMREDVIRAIQQERAMNSLRTTTLTGGSSSHLRPSNLAFLPHQHNLHNAAAAIAAAATPESQRPLLQHHEEALFSDLLAPRLCREQRLQEEETHLTSPLMANNEETRRALVFALLAPGLRDIGKEADGKVSGRK